MTRARDEVHVAPEEKSRVLDVPRPVAEMLDVLEVARLSQGRDVEFFKVSGREVAAVPSNSGHRVREESPHRRRRACEIRIRKIEPNARGRTADAQAVV